MASEIRWLPLESNPEVMNKYVKALGVAPESLQFYDVYGFDADLLGMVPRPVTAVVMLYPISEKTENKILGTEENNKDVYYMKQTIGNACGTIGLIHALCNNTNSMKLDESKHLFKFFEKTKDMSPEDRGKYLESDKEFGEVHEESALEGQTTAPPRDEKVNLHFIAFVHQNGVLFELDGSKNSPINHGKTTPETLLEDTVVVVKKFMALDPDNLNFTVVALAKSQ